MHGSEYLSSNLLIAYPFKDTASALARDRAPSIDPEVVVPLDLVVAAAFEQTVERADLAGFTLHVAQMVLTAAELKLYVATNDEDLTTRLLFTIPRQLAEVGSPFQVFTATPIDEDLDYYTGKLVIYQPALNSWLAGGVELPDVPFEVAELPFEPTTLNRAPDKVLSITLRNEGLFGPAVVTVDDAVMMTAGYNIDLTAIAATSDTTQIRIAALPSAGLGRVPCEEAEDLGVTSLGSLRAISGDIQIVPGEERCYNVGIVGVVPGEDGSVESARVAVIGGGCDPCCPCEDYVNVLTAIKEIAKRVTTVHNILRYRHTDYTRGVYIYHRNILPQIKNETTWFWCDAAPGPVFHTGVQNWRGSPHWCGITMGIINRNQQRMIIEGLDFVVDAQIVDQDWWLFNPKHVMHHPPLNPRDPELWTIDNSLEIIVGTNYENLSNTMAQGTASRVPGSNITHVKLYQDSPTYCPAEIQGPLLSGGGILHGMRVRKPFADGGSKIPGYGYSFTVTYTLRYRLEGSDATYVATRTATTNAHAEENSTGGPVTGAGFNFPKPNPPLLQPMQ